jgi:hypothetical protein
MVNNEWVEPAEPAVPAPQAAAASPAAGSPAVASPAAGSPAAAPRGAAASPRSERTPKDMAISLLVLLIPIALLLTFYRVVLNGDDPVTVDTSSTIQEAQAAKAFPVAVPGGLGADWHASSATFQRLATGATLRIGYVDEDDNGVQLIESSVPPATLLPAELGNAPKQVDVYRADARMWRLYDARPGEQALVLGETGRTVIVVGRTDVRNLQKLASSLS